MSLKFQETHYCKVNINTVMADCHSCVSHRCHDCDEKVRWWMDFCPRCYNKLGDQAKKLLVSHHARVEGS